MTTMTIPGVAEFRGRLLVARRRALEDWIERAIALLDSLDPDPEAEDEHDAEAPIAMAEVRP